MSVCMRASTLMHAQLLSVFSEYVCLSVHIWTHRGSFGVCVHVPCADVIVGLPCGNVWVSASVITEEMRNYRSQEVNAALCEVSIAHDGTGCPGGCREDPAGSLLKLHHTLRAIT